MYRFQQSVTRSTRQLACWPKSANINGEKLLTFLPSFDKSVVWWPGFASWNVCRISMEFIRCLSLLLGNRRWNFRGRRVVRGSSICDLNVEIPWKMRLWQFFRLIHRSFAFNWNVSESEKLLKTRRSGTPLNYNCTRPTVVQIEFALNKRLTQFIATLNSIDKSVNNEYILWKMGLPWIWRK